MALSLHEVVAGTYNQILASTAGVLAKGRAHCEANNIDLQTFVEARLRDDMNPLSFQVISVWHHSLGAVKGVQAGEFAPPPSLELDYAGLDALVQEAQAGIAAIDAASFDSLEGADLVFKLGGNEIPFVAKDFLLSFSLPKVLRHERNLVTADILRAEGVSIGKRDFLGALRFKGA